MPRDQPVGERLFTRELWPMAPPLLGMLAGLVVLAAGDWRTGLLVIGGAVGLAGVLRAVLPQRLAGLLAVRGRLFDTLVMIVLGAAIITVALLR